MKGYADGNGHFRASGCGNGKQHDEYADGNSDRGKKMRKAICEKFGFASLGFQTIEGVVNAIGIDRCKLCTYCWDGKE